MDYSPCCFLSLNFQEKEVYFNVIFLYGFIRDCGNIFYGGCWYSSVNVTTMILFFTSICIKLIIVLWSSIITILLLVITSWRLMKGPMILSTVILGGTGYFQQKPILFWIIFRRTTWLMLFKHTGKNQQ